MVVDFHFAKILIILNLSYWKLNGSNLSWSSWRQYKLDALFIKIIARHYSKIGLNSLCVFSG